MFVHFRELTGINIREKIDSAITQKGKRILKWMEEEPNKHIRKIHEELSNASCSANAEVAAMIYAVMSYLQDKEEFLHICVKVTS